MNYAIIRNVLGKLMIVIAGLMSLSLIFCIAFQEDFINYVAFLVPIGLLLLIGFLFNIKKAKSTRILAREGFIIAGVSWLIIAFFGCIPFMITGEIPNFFDAFFEMSSGFTTTGASILTGEQVESLSRSLQFWRSFSHWIGGMGVLVFILAIIPESKDGSAVHILRAESPGPQVGRLVSKMQATSRILYLIYLGLTIILFLFLWLGPDKKMGLFNSLIYSFGTAGTGGFSIHSESLGYFSVYSQYVVGIFMFVFGINFSLFYFILIRNFKDVFSNSELRWYIAIIFGSILIIFINLLSVYDSVEECFRYAFFQVGTVMSTTGFATTDFNQWPSLSKAVLLILMIVGGCAGSTAGGFKVVRVNILLKSSIRKIRNMVSPRKVEVQTLDGKHMAEKTIDGVESFFIVYILVIISTTLIISLDNFDMFTNISAAISCVNNVGPGFNVVGPTGSFKDFSSLSKFVLSIAMIAGRLELFPILVLFSPNTWKRNL